MEVRFENFDPSAPSSSPPGFHAPGGSSLAARVRACHGPYDIANPPINPNPDREERAFIRQWIDRARAVGERDRAADAWMHTFKLIEGRMWPDLFFTGTFRSAVSVAEAEVAVGKFINKINHWIFGRESDRNPEARVAAVGIVGPGAGGRVHVHLLLATGAISHSKGSDGLQAKISGYWDRRNGDTEMSLYNPGLPGLEYIVNHVRMKGAVPVAYGCHPERRPPVVVRKELDAQKAPSGVQV